jgi:hypothetical protein
MKWTLRLIWGLTFFLWVLQCQAVNFPLSWQWSNPWPHGNNIIDLAYTNGLWVQVAERGQLYTSTDQLGWTPQDTHTSRALRAVTFFRNQILAVGENTVIVTGPSSALNATELGSSDWLEGVAASPQLAVAVGDNGAVYTSSDGQSWQRQNTPFSDWMRSVAYGTPGGKDLFVAVGEAGFVASSADGVHWQTQPRLTTQDLNRVTWFSGEFWMLGDAGTCFQGTSGLAWQAIATGSTNTLNAFAGSNAMRLVAGDAEVHLRIGQQPWSNELNSTNPYPPDVWTYLSATGGTNSFLLCGRTGMIVQSVVGTNYATGWFTVSDSPRNWLWDIKRFPAVYLAVGDRATILSSVDAISWDPELPPSSATNAVFLGVGGKTNLAVVVGSAGTIITSVDVPQTVVSTNTDGTLATNTVSTLGIYWNAVSPPPTTNDLQGVTVFNNQFLVSGAAGLVLASSDAQSWQTRKTPANTFLSSLETYPGLVVAVGQRGTILTSPDAVNWTSRGSGSTNWIYRVRYLGGKLIAAGENGTILVSNDGTTWSAVNSGTTSWLNDIDWIGNTYFAVGDQGTVLTSTDASSWTDRGTITGKSLFAAATDSGTLVTVGIEGVILRSQVVTFNSPVALLSYPTKPQEDTFIFSGQPGQRFTLDRSSSLTGWLSGSMLQIDTSGTLLHHDGGTNDLFRQFYRTTSQP